MQLYILSILKHLKSKHCTTFTEKEKHESYSRLRIIMKMLPAMKRKKEKHISINNLLTTIYRTDRCI